MLESRIFKLIVKSDGAASYNGLKYVYSNIDIINEMGIKIQITRVESDTLTRETVATFNSRGITSFPAMITDTGKVRNGVAEIKELFERNKKNYNEWLDKKNGQAGNRQQPRELGPEYSFGGDEFGGGRGASMENFYSREMNLDAFKRDQKQGENGDSMEGGIGNGDDYNRRIADWKRKVAPPARKQSSSFDGGGGDIDDDNMHMQQRGREHTVDEPENNIMTRNYDISDMKYMEGVDDLNYSSEI